MLQKIKSFCSPLPTTYIYIYIYIGILYLDFESNHAKKAFLIGRLLGWWRGVPHPMIEILIFQKQFKKAKSKDKKSLIFQNWKKKSEKDDKVRFLFTHNQSNPLSTCGLGSVKKHTEFPLSIGKIWGWGQYDGGRNYIITF